MAAPRLLFVCTGNATRSVIAEAIVRRERPEWPVYSAGTRAIPGLPSSRRTLAALASVDVSALGHRSRTLNAEHLSDADLVIAFERDHVSYIRARFPEASAYTTTLPRLLRDDSWPLPNLAFDQIRDLPEVDDPAGGDVGDFIECARGIAYDLTTLLPRLDGWAPRAE